MSRNRREPLRPKHAKVWEFIQAEIAAGRPIPTAARITDHMGWSIGKGPHPRYQSAKDALIRLAASGYLVMKQGDTGKPYSWEIAP